MNPNLAILLRALNAALEHVPPETKALLVEVAQPAAKALEEVLKAKPE